MVYYEPPKRAAPKQVRSTVFTMLPDEIILDIARRVNIPTVLNLRMTNSNFVRVCNDTLAKRNTTLYLHPTTSSLRQAVDICEHPLFGRHITNVVLLGKVLWRDIDLARPVITRDQYAKDITRASVRGRFCPWPDQPFVDKAAVHDSWGVEASGFQEQYAQLLTPLSQLPKLRAFSFTDSVRKPGWNQTSQQLFDSHAKKCASHPATKLHQMRLADVDVVFGLLYTLGESVTSLQLDTELPFSGPMVHNLRQSRSGVSRRPLSTSLLRLDYLHNLTSLDLVLLIGTTNGEHALQRGMIACTAPSLKALKLIMIPQHARSQAAAVYEDLSLLSTSDILPYGGAGRSMDCYFKRLESLTLVYREPAFPSKCKDQRRRVRPSCQRLDLETMLDSVRHSIQHISIHNIVFPPNDRGPALQPTWTNTNVHSAIAGKGGIRYPSLDHFEWRVNRYKHDPCCRSEGGSANHRDCGKFLCGTYVHMITLKMYEDAAQTLGAELKTVVEGEDEAFGYWDFGAAIMRDRQAAMGFNSGQEG